MPTGSRRSSAGNPQDAEAREAAPTGPPPAIPRNDPAIHQRAVAAKKAACGGGGGHPRVWGPAGPTKRRSCRRHGGRPFTRLAGEHSSPCLPLEKSTGLGGLESRTRNMRQRAADAAALLLRCYLRQNELSCLRVVAPMPTGQKARRSGMTRKGRRRGRASPALRRTGADLDFPSSELKAVRVPSGRSTHPGPGKTESGQPEPNGDPERLGPCRGGPVGHSVRRGGATDEGRFEFTRAGVAGRGA